MAKKQKSKEVKAWEDACKKDEALKSFGNALKSLKKGDSFVWSPVTGKVEKNVVSGKECIK